MLTRCPKCRHFFTAIKAGTKSPQAVAKANKRWAAVPKEDRSEPSRKAVNARWAKQRAKDAVKPICSTCYHFTLGPVKDAQFGTCGLKLASLGAIRAEVRLKGTCGEHRLKAVVAG